MNGWVRVNYRIIAASAVLGLLIGFQNCTPFSRSDDRRQALEKGGDGYTGKTIYIHATLQSPCSDGSLEKSVIELSDSKAFVTKEDCQPVVPPRPLLDPGFMPYNPGALFVGPLLFELSGTSVWSSVACRGQSALPDPWGRRSFADIQLFETAQRSPEGPILQGHIKIGYFDPQGRLASSETVSISQALPDPNPALNHRAFILTHEDAKLDQTSRLDLSSSGADLVYHSAKFENPLIVVRMSCSNHE